MSPKIVAGTALVLASAAAMIYRRQTMTVEATNSHTSFFTSNLTAPAAA